MVTNGQSNKHNSSNFGRDDKVCAPASLTKQHPVRRKVHKSDTQVSARVHASSIRRHSLRSKNCRVVRVTIAWSPTLVIDTRARSCRKPKEFRSSSLRNDVRDLGAILCSKTHLRSTLAVWSAQPILSGKHGIPKKQGLQLYKRG